MHKVRITIMMSTNIASAKTAEEAVRQARDCVIRQMEQAGIAANKLRSTSGAIFHLEEVHGELEAVYPAKERERDSEGSESR
jgi:hypothetical protein